MANDYSDRMLRTIIAEAQRALRINDPIGRADIIAAQIQPYAGWALRWAIQDCRDKGMTWETIAGVVGRSYPALLRQFDAGGPIYTARAAQSADTRNYDGQTPLRRAATGLAKQMSELGLNRPDTVTYSLLHEAVDELTTAQCMTDDPAPLLRATREVLALADLVRPHAQPLQVEVETEVWDTIDTLKACFERDRGQIKAASDVSAARQRAGKQVSAILEQMAAETRSRIGSTIFDPPPAR